MDTQFEIKSARMTLLLDPGKKRALEDYCAKHDLTPSQVVRGLIRHFLQEEGVRWTPAGAPEDYVQANSRAQTDVK